MTTSQPRRCARRLSSKVPAADIARYGVERFGPVAFVVETRDTAHSFEIWRELTETRGALTALVYSTDPCGHRGG